MKKQKVSKNKIKNYNPSTWILAYLNEKVNENLILIRNTYRLSNGKIGYGIVYKLKIVEYKRRLGGIKKVFTLSFIDLPNTSKVIPILPEDRVKVPKLGTITKINGGYIYQFDYNRHKPVFAEEIKPYL